MRLLLIDTCGATGSIALADTDLAPPVLATAFLPGRTASERLVPAVKVLVESRGGGLQSLAAVVIVHGPGSFTVVRIGLSAAKGLCEALAIPLIAISRLAVLAEIAPLSPAAGLSIHALLDAGRGEFYYGEYVDGFCLREALFTRDELQAVIAQGQKVVVCEAAVAESLEVLNPSRVPEPTAAAALPTALRRIRDGEVDDIATLDANYVRRTDSEIFAKPKPSAR